jgi:hypothetical protein
MAEAWAGAVQLGGVVVSWLGDFLTRLGLLVETALLAASGPPVRYDLGLLTVDVAPPMNDWTVYQFGYNNVLLSVEQTSSSKTPLDLATEIADRLSAIYGPGADIRITRANCKIGLAR